MPGAAVFPEAHSTAHSTPQPALDRCLADLKRQKEHWASSSATDRAKLVDDLLVSVKQAAAGWVAAGLQAKGLDPNSPQAGEEWLTGPYIVARYLRLLRRTLIDIARRGTPRLPGRPYMWTPDRVAVHIFPTDLYDKLMFFGYRADVLMQPGVTLENLPSTIATAYREGSSTGRICLVLGAGNVSSIGPLDALGKLFVENQVVLLKLNPVNDYLGPHCEAALRPLVERGVLRIVQGGSDEGAYLCRHDDVDSIHITGSDKTHDAIVFGPGLEGQQRKSLRTPLLAKPITSELGNVSAAIAVPGPWRDRDYAFQAENLAAMLTNNAGFNCNALRVIITPRNWDGRAKLLDELRRVLATVPPRKAYYPGAADRLHQFIAEHPAAERLGARPSDGQLPWVLVPDVDPTHAHDICFRSEAFCSLACETALDAADPPSYLQRAVEFVNGTLWGSLAASLIVHPRSLKQPAIRQAVTKAVMDLRVGTVALNHWSGVNFALGSTTWGAFPGHELHDIQSGRGVVHNSYMFAKAEKTILYGPFRPPIKPAWFPSHRQAHRLGQKLVDFECRPSPLKLPGIFLSALEL